MMNKRGNGVIGAILVILITVTIILILDLYYAQLARLIGFPEIFNILIRTMIIFVFSFIMLRLLGKRQLSQLTFIDLLIIIALGSAVGDVMIYTEDIAPLMNSVLAVGFITILVMIINRVVAKHVSIGRLIEGRETILVKNGKILTDALIKENMNEDELRSELREHGIHHLYDLERVVLEPTGKLSVKKKKRNTNTKKK